MRKIRLISNFMTSQLGQKQLRYLYCPISHNQSMKFGQLIARKIFFFKNHAENEAGRLVPILFLFFKKALYKVKASGLQLRFNII